MILQPPSACQFYGKCSKQKIEMLDNMNDVIGSVYVKRYERLARGNAASRRKNNTQKCLNIYDFVPSRI